MTVPPPPSVVPVPPSEPPPLESSPVESSPLPPLPKPLGVVPEQAARKITTAHPTKGLMFASVLATLTTSPTCGFDRRKLCPCACSKFRFIDSDLAAQKKHF
jgi:hypothetical protein